MVASLCQNVALHGDLAQLAAKLRELLPLSASQGRIGLAAPQFISLGLACPGINAGLVASELAGQFAGLAPSPDQFDHLLTEFRRVSPSSLAHFVLRRQNNNVSGLKGQLQVTDLARHNRIESRLNFGICVRSVKISW